MSSKSRSERLSERLQRTKQHRQWLASSSQSGTSATNSTGTAKTEPQTERQKVTLHEALVADKKRRSPNEERSVASAPSRITGESITQRRLRITERRKVMGSPSASPPSSPHGSKEVVYYPMSPSMASPRESPIRNFSELRLSYKSRISPSLAMMETSPPKPFPYEEESHHDYNISPQPSPTPTSETTGETPAKLIPTWRGRSVDQLKSPASIPSTPIFSSPAHHTVKIRTEKEPSIPALQKKKWAISSSKNDLQSVRALPDTSHQTRTNATPSPSVTLSSTSPTSSDLSPSVSKSQPLQHHSSWSDRTPRTAQSIPISTPITSAAPWSRDSLRRSPATPLTNKGEKEKPLNVSSIQEASIPKGTDDADVTLLRSPEVDEKVSSVGAYPQREPRLPPAYESRPSPSQLPAKLWSPATDRLRLEDEPKSISRLWPPPKTQGGVNVVSPPPSHAGSSTPSMSNAKQIMQAPSPEYGVAAAKASWQRKIGSPLGQEPSELPAQRPVEVTSWQAKRQASMQKESASPTTAAVEPKIPKWKKGVATPERNTLAQEQSPKPPVRQWPPPQRQKEPEEIPDTPPPLKIAQTVQPRNSLVTTSINSAGLSEKEKPLNPWMKTDLARSQQARTPTKDSFSVTQERTPPIARQSPPWVRKETMQTPPESRPQLSASKKSSQPATPLPEPPEEVPLPAQATDSQAMIETPSHVNVASLRATFGGTLRSTSVKAPSSGLQKKDTSRAESTGVPSWVTNRATSPVDVSGTSKTSEVDTNTSFSAKSKPMALTVAHHLEISSPPPSSKNSVSPTLPESGHPISPSRLWIKKDSPRSAQFTKSLLAATDRQTTPDALKRSWVTGATSSPKHSTAFEPDRVQSWPAIASTNQSYAAPQKSVSIDNVAESPNGKHDSPTANVTATPTPPVMATKDATPRWNPTSSPMVPPIASESPTKSLAALAADSVIRTDYHFNQFQFHDSEDSCGDSDSKSNSATPKKSDLPIQFQSILYYSNSLENVLSMDSDASCLVLSPGMDESETGLFGVEIVENQDYSSSPLLLPNIDDYLPREGDKVYQLNGVDLNRPGGDAHTTRDLGVDQLGSIDLNLVNRRNLDLFKTGGSEAGSSAVSSAVFGDPISFGAAGGDNIMAQPLPVSERAKAIEQWAEGKSPTASRAPPVLRESYRGQGMIRDDVDKKFVRFHDVLTDVKIMEPNGSDIASDFSTTVGDSSPYGLDDDSAIDAWTLNDVSTSAPPHNVSPPRTNRDAAAILRYFQNAEPEKVDQDRWGDKDPEDVVAIRDDDSITSSVVASASGETTEDALRSLSNWSNPESSQGIPAYSAALIGAPPQSVMPSESPVVATPISLVPPSRAPSGTSAFSPLPPKVPRPQDLDHFSPQAFNHFAGFSSSSKTSKNVFDPFVPDEGDDDDDSFYQFGKTDAPFFSADTKSPPTAEKSPSKGLLRPPRQTPSTKSRRYDEAMQSSYDDEYYSSRVAAASKYDPYGENGLEI